MPRPDPRAEPETDSETSTPQVSVERVVVSKIDAPKVDTTVDTEDEEGPAPSSQRSVTVKSEDSRLAEIEPFVERGDWKAVASILGSLEVAGKLPPNLGLFVAIAHNEMAEDGSAQARHVAVRSMAALLGLPAENELARVLARRLLRKNPTGMRHRPAPPAKTSLAIVAVVLVLGGALGWFLSSPMFSRLLHQWMHR